MRHLGLAPLLVLVSLPACEKPQQDTTNPVYVSDADMDADKIPDYSKSACVGQTRTVKTPAGDTNVTCKAEGKLFKLYVDDAVGGNLAPADLQAAAATLDRFSDPSALDGMQGAIGNVFTLLGTPAAALLDGGKLPLFAVSDLGGTAWTAIGTPASGAKTLEAVYRANPDETLDGTFNLSTATKAAGSSIASAADPDEEAWIVESLGWAASLASGVFGTDEFVDAFLAEPNVAWGPGSKAPNAGATLLFGGFLYERLGAEAVKALVAEPANGWEGIEAVSKGTKRHELFKRWAFTIWFTDPGTGYGFKFSGLPQAQATIVKDEPKFAGTSEPWGLNFYMLSPGAEIPLVFTTEGDAFAFVGVRGEEGIERTDLVPGELHRLTLEGSNTAVLVVSAPTKSPYILTVDEASAVAAEKALAKAKKQAEKDAKKQAKADEKPGKKSDEKPGKKSDEKPGKKADKKPDE